MLAALSTIDHGEAAPGARITASIGLATYTPKQRFPSTLALLEAADHALYAAKLCGRNRCEVYEELSATSRSGTATR
jgi:PleD family two-component response regulator